MGMSAGDLQATMNLIEMGLEDEEQVQKIFGKVMNAFMLAMNNKEIAASYTNLTREATGFNVNVECFGELEDQIKNWEVKLEDQVKNLNTRIDLIGSTMTRVIETCNEIHSRSVYMFLTLTEYIQAKDPELAKVINAKLIEFSNKIMQGNQAAAQEAPANN